MPRQTKPLTDSECRNAKPGDKDYKLFDGGGLFLLVKTSGAKLWRMKYAKPDGKESSLSFGAYPDVPLSAARKLRDDTRALLASGKDPQTERAAEQLATRYAASNTFELVALEWHAKEKASSKWGDDHAGRILQRLRDDVFPHIGRQPVENLKTRDLLVVLQAAAARDALDLAKRLRQYMTAIMRYAVQTGRIDSNPALDLQGAVASRQARHHPALPLTRTSELAARISGYSSRIARDASLFALLTGARSSEFRFAQWSEFDLGKGIWTIPPEREAVEGIKYSERGEKMGRERIIYLSRQTVALLARMQEINGTAGFVFAGQKPGTPISENTVNQLLRRVGYDTQQDVCLHGFRTMMVSALNESGRFNPDAVERHIGHEGKASAGAAVRAIYNRNAQYLKERQAMLQWWADWLDALQDAGHHIEPCDFNPGKAAVLVLNRAA
ncbi:tyrosine-type recombinase/integrase [Chitinilyticum piscinae]|uniref:Integrase arm-type DNA-binding domain-containing protein n=1 Tax=Chitinilyticum piscinae TaxID=2866724 RepID=A0A8J7FKN2_9NEIS|nr:integrase arm-type DNA-binding domain-containing protein [Chitinilyticum piscinae]MBE9607861.1 integrase arm-type DNA-binding domain-containing protein [Chitinilyticum piscinae]